VIRCRTRSLASKLLCSIVMQLVVAFLVGSVAISGSGCGDDAPAAPDAATPGMDAAIDAAAIDAPDAPPACPTPTTYAAATTPEVVIAGESSAMGIFDPSIVYPAGAPGGAMAYSAVPTQETIRTRIAISADAGATWTNVAEANTPELATLATTGPECPTGSCTGNLISETPTLVLDPLDPDPQTRWKLYAHRYLIELDGTLHYTMGALFVQTAPEAHGPWTAPRKLFGAPTPAPYSSEGAQYLTTSIPALAGCIVLTEPAALVTPVSLELALGCVYFEGSVGKIKIVHVRSTDHGATWAGVGTLLAPGGADCLPNTTPNASVNAANFIATDTGVMLSVTSSDPGYHGCLLYPVEDLGTGRLATHPTKMIVPDTGQFSGACTWSPATGYYIITGFFDQARPFRILRAPTP